MRLHPYCGNCALCHLHDDGLAFCRREGHPVAPVGGCRFWTPADPQAGIPYPDGSLVQCFPVHPVFVRDTVERKNVSREFPWNKSGSVVTPGQSAMGGTKPQNRTVGQVLMGEHFHFKTRLSLSSAGRIQRVKTL